MLYWPFYVLCLPTLVGTFSLYSMARLSDTSWGNRTVAAKSVFSGPVTDKEIGDLQSELKANAGVALIFVTFFIVVLEFFVIYFRTRDWFIVAVMATLFFTTLVQAVMSALFFLGKHISGETCRQIIAGRWSCCCCCPRVVKRSGYTKV